MHRHVAPLHLQTVVDTIGETVKPFVHCPRSDEPLSALACVGCRHMRDIEWDPEEGGTVTCAVDDAAPPVDPRADLGEVAARTPIHTIAASVTTCVRQDLTIRELREALARRGARNAVVVDADGKPVGLVSATDLTLAADFGRVADMMTRVVHALPDDAPVGYAIALMAFEDVSVVPVVAEDGTLVGSCHALDVMRWIASRLGYVVPGPTRPRAEALAP
jgi:CBS domain-containing protein